MGDAVQGSFRDTVTLVYPGGRACGTWNDGRFHGPLSHSAPDGSHYWGTCEKGLPHGNGIVHQEDGRRCEASWYEGMPDGKGTVAYADGSCWRGQWNSGHRDQGAVIAHGRHRLVARSVAVVLRAATSMDGLITMWNRVLGLFFCVDSIYLKGSMPQNEPLMILHPLVAPSFWRLHHTHSTRPCWPLCLFSSEATARPSPFLCRPGVTNLAMPFCRIRPRPANLDGQRTNTQE
nr:F-box domain [Pandoravirus aubagnensis]